MIKHEKGIHTGQRELGIESKKKEIEKIKSLANTQLKANRLIRSIYNF